MKKLITRLILVLVGITVLALVAAYLSLNSIVKKGVETVGPQLTKVETRLGGVSLSPWSGHGRLSELLFGNPAGYKTPSAIKVGDIRVTVKPSSVISGTVVVDDINIQAPEITFEGSLRGSNLSKILENLEGLANLSKEAKELTEDAKAVGQAATEQAEKSLKSVKEISKDATQQIDKASKGIKDLIKKKTD